ncbi:MAG: hypothetical protein IH991_12845, partial [Planctomycetes bacterium]|nr:hypothetical protein [Planctomycetota bacterium]
MSILTSEAFFEVLEKSGLLDAEQLAQARQQVGDDPNPKSAARKLVRNGHLSKWQARILLMGRHALQIGKYKLVDRIGRDDEGEVFLASHDRMGRQV